MGIEEVDGVRKRRSCSCTKEDFLPEVVQELGKLLKCPEGDAVPSEGQGVEQVT